MTPSSEESEFLTNIHKFNIMGRKFTLLFLLLMVVGIGKMQAQLEPGSIAPNFTGTDLNGNTWTLYDLLDQGKSVVIEVSATWCAPCWAYHNTHTLANLYDTYGPAGTDEMMVFFIEGDGTTNTNCLYGSSGCNSSTQGNWTNGTPFPIIDNAAIANAYEISYFPTIYHICPNRIVNEIGQVTNIGTIYGFNGSCQVASGNQNAGILKYRGFEGQFCQEATFGPSAQFQNMGQDTMTSATFALLLDGVEVATKDWTGSMKTYDVETIEFDDVTIDATTTIEIRVASVNGGDDEVADNDAVQAVATLAADVANTIVTLSFTTDNYAAESYWELLDGNDNVVYSGGNAGIFTNVIGPDSYANATTYTHQLALPADGCYRFVVYDAYGDGICCGTAGNGSFSITDAAGELLFAGGEFETIDDRPFEVKDASPIVNNARIALYDGQRGEFCQVLTFTPEIVVQNVGNNEITSLTIEVTGVGTTQTIDWTGSIAPLGIATISLNELELDGTADVEFAITAVNGEEDAYDFGNEYGVQLSRVPHSEYDMLNLRIITDNYGYETYWQITDDAGDVIASGGNSVVGVDGGGARIAAAGDPGAYGNNQTINVSVQVPADGCYNFVAVDDYGDGMCCQYGNGSYRLTDQDNVVLFQGGAFTINAAEDFEVATPVGTEALTELGDLKMFPNPVRTELTLNFDLIEAMPLQVSVYNALGQLVQTVTNADFSAGKHTLRVDASNLSDGVYSLAIQNGKKQLSRKFVVQK